MSKLYSLEKQLNVIIYVLYPKKFIRHLQKSGCRFHKWDILLQLNTKMISISNYFSYITVKDSNTKGIIYFDWMYLKNDTCVKFMFAVTLYMSSHLHRLMCLKCKISNYPANL